jgi:hypothetical protein
MRNLELLLDIPADVMAAKLFPLLSGQDVVRLDSAYLAHHFRQASRKVFDVCAPVPLQLYTSREFELEYAAWGWFWKRSLPFVPSPNKRRIHELAKMIGYEHLVYGYVHIDYWGDVDPMTIGRVLSEPSLVQKVSQLSVSFFRSAEDMILRNLQVFTNLDSLWVEYPETLSDELLLAMLQMAAPLKEIALGGEVHVTDTMLEALMRHAPTLMSTRLTPFGATSLNLYRFYAQCKNLHTLNLSCGFEPWTCRFTPVPASAVTAIATGCPRLRTVWVGLVDHGVDALTVFATHCPELQSMSGMTSLYLTDAGLAALTGNCVNFVKLQSTYWAVTDETVVHAAQALLARLQHVALFELTESEYSDTYSRTLVKAVAYMCDLQTFHLTGSDPTVRLQALLALKCTKLRSVLLTCEDRCNDPAVGEAIAAVASRNPLLEKLRWTGHGWISVGNGWLSDGALVTIAASCPLLQELYVQEAAASFLTDASLMALAQGCPKLTVVQGLSGPALTDASVIALADHCPRLTRVNLKHSPLVTEAALTTLVQRCLELQQIHVCANSMDASAMSRISAAHTGSASYSLSVIT